MADPYVVKVIATDIDGTITDAQGRIHLDALRSIRRCEENGIPVILVSGRPLPYVDALALYAGTSGIIIGENGAVLRDRTGESLTGDPTAARRALAVLQRRFSLRPTDDNIYRRVDVALEKTVDGRELQSAADRLELGISVQETNVMLHLVDRRVSKGRTLLTVLQKLGIMPGECAVFGDSPNDRPMFEIGAVGVALGNSVAELKERAAVVVDGAFGGGFVEGIRRLFGG